jgi:S1-C subfamily serine protease/HSP20 family molecular chaperone IbpA
MLMDMCRRQMTLTSVIFLLTVAFAAAESSSPRETPVVKVVRENAGAVVNISTEHIILLRENPVWGHYGSEFDFWFDQFFGQSGRMRALKLKSVGSGVIVDKEGMIITNAHVVHMASNIFVILSDGTSVRGKVVYENPADDLALIKVDPPKPLKAVKLGQADDILIGETVVAIGNPLGLENSVTVGIISGKEREIYSSRGEKVSDELIQTDAPINPGNSGGALLNLNGELVGINVAVVQHSQSIGFAVPIKKVKEAIHASQRNQPFAIKHRAQAVPPSAAVPSPRLQGQGWDPFKEMEQMRKEMDEMFRGIWSRRDKTDKGGMFNTDIFYDTSLDMKETPDGYEIKLDVSGLDKDKIDIEINDSSLTISGQSSGTEEETSPQSLYRSRRFHSFLRTIPLPADADSESVTTDIKGDALMIRLRRK